MFLLISRSLFVVFQYFLRFVHGQGQQATIKKEQKFRTKETGKFHSQSHFINLLAEGFAHLFQGAASRTLVHNLGRLWGFLLFSSKGALFSLFAE